MFSFLTRVYHKKTFTGLLTNYFSFTSYSYKVGLIRTLIDRAYKINNTWLGLHEDITKLMEILKKNLFPAHLIERAVNRYISGTLSNHCPQGSLPTSPIFYFELPYIGHFFCRNSEKIGHLLGVKDPIPGGLRSRVVVMSAKHVCNFKCFVVFFKLLTCLLISRSFGNIIIYVMMYRDMYSTVRKCIVAALALTSINCPRRFAKLKLQIKIREKKTRIKN